MSKKGHTNNPGGRPLKRPEDKIQKPVRQLGRIDEVEWAALQIAAEHSGKSFTQWALEILLRAAKRELRK